MKAYWLRLIPEQPLRLDDPYIIPATAIRGAIAGVLLATCVPGHEHDAGPCSPNCRYWSLFGEGLQFTVGPGYAGAGDETQPFLITARTCSRAPGFKSAGAHGIFDIALRQWAFEAAAGELTRLLAPFAAVCPVCEAVLVPCTGLYTRLGEREYVQVGEVGSPVKVHFSAMNRTRKRTIGTFQTEGFAISRGIYYTARLSLPDRLVEVFQQTISGGLMIGGKRARGMGEVRTELVPCTIEPLPLAERIALLNRTIRAEERFYMAMGAAHITGTDGEWFFTLDLSAPAFVDYATGPTLIPLPSVLPSVVPVRQWLTPAVSRGWHSGAGLPRRTQIGAVGTALYRVPADANRTVIEELLAFIELEGVGLSRERGCGQVTVCHPFHAQVEPL